MEVAQPILDATCGGRMMWFNKQHPAVLYVDRREVPETVFYGNRRFEVNPDVVADFQNLPFPDQTFHLVVFDPPHLMWAGPKSYMGLKYGRLPKDWQPVIREGFRECMRVLREHGTLVFKWSAVQIPTRDVINAIGIEPLFGHLSGREMNTHWMVFMRFPKEEESQ